TGEDYQWFFDETWYGSSLSDYAVSVINEHRPLEGHIDGPDGMPIRRPDADLVSESPGWQSTVTPLRRGEVRLHSDLFLEFTDGRSVNETWTGQERWKRFTDTKKVRHAVVAPRGRNALDVHPSNNNWLDVSDLSRREASKWAFPYLFWLQGLLEM